MKNMWLVFVVGAVLSWGCYVSMIHEGGKLLGGNAKSAPLRAFLCVGTAYFVTAVIIPLVVLLVSGESVAMKPWGAAVSTFA
ncbi:MAG: hypothetical protein ACRDD1_07015, partial [Planctomycetia bacterium]